MKYRDLTIITSLFNEASGVPKLIGQVETLRQRFPAIQRAILVNNGSSDNTRGALEDAIRQLHSSSEFYFVLDNPYGKGWGDGIRAAEAAAETDYVLTFPSDMQFPVDSISSVIAAFENSPPLAQCVLGERMKRKDGLFNAIRGKIWAHYLSKKLRYQKVKDPASQLRIHQTGKFRVRSDLSSFVYDLALNRELDVVDSLILVPVEFVHRGSGESSMGSSPLAATLRAISSLQQSNLLREAPAGHLDQAS